MTLLGLPAAQNDDAARCIRPGEAAEGKLYIDGREVINCDDGYFEEPASAS
jgi:hypothetical protein